MDPKRVLIVDDEIGFTNLVKLNLEKTGNYVVRIENTGDNVVAVAREFQPQVILLDIVMPGKDGGQVFADLQADPDAGRIPVAFLTATVSIKSVADRGNQIRGVPFIAKPISPKDLVREIELILKAKR